MAATGGSSPNKLATAKRESAKGRRLIIFLLGLNLVVMLSFRLGTATTASSSAASTPSDAIAALPQIKASVDDSGRDESSIAASLRGQKSSSEERNFLEIASKTGTDKVQGRLTLERCKQNNGTDCTRPGCARPECRVWGHFYQTMYQRHLGHLSTDDAEPFQFLEIGYYNGRGYDTYVEFFPRAEAHSMEISCIPEGPREEGKWPWGNFASKNKGYDDLLKQRRLHCGDASDVKWIDKIWREEMKRDDAPQLKVVVDDGSHLAHHMAQSVFFWFPRLEPRGMLVVEDIQPIQEADLFRTQFLPQIMADLHYCGDPKWPDKGPCFPTLQPLLASIHCEMHICIFERNDKPAVELDLEQSTMPKTALDASMCPSLGKKK